MKNANTLSNLVARVTLSASAMPARGNQVTFANKVGEMWTRLVPARDLLDAAAAARAEGFTVVRITHRGEGSCKGFAWYAL